MQNSLIRMDLHIHSSASAYKERKGYVENCSLSDIDTLLKKLNEQNINLFSITDHNRFNSDLYESVEAKLNENISFPNIKNIVAGVEFDVVLENGQQPCHIITIFDAKNDTSKYNKIKNVIDNNLLKSPNDYYLRDDFERIIKLINLDVLLIAHQHNSLSRKSDTRSFSDAINNPEDWLKFKYINALEYQKSRVQGILLADFVKMDVDIPLLTGSDCHNWERYPAKDKHSHTNDKFFTVVRALPTFKGLLMAFTSPLTRFNRTEHNNPAYLREIQVNGDCIQFSPGLNAIIGENGSGKTSLLYKIIGKVPPDRKQFLENNEISLSNAISQNIKIVHQAELVNEVNKKSLFSKEIGLFREVDNSRFAEAFQKYQADLLRYIKGRYTRTQKVERANSKVIPIRVFDGSNYYVRFNDNCISLENNKYKELLDKLYQAKNIMMQLKPFVHDNNEIRIIQNIIKQFSKIINSNRSRYKSLEIEIKLTNLCKEAISNYETKTYELKTSDDKEKDAYEKTKKGFRQVIFEIWSYQTVSFPAFPVAIKGEERNPKAGFIFLNKTKYSRKNLLNDFLSVMFTTNYRNLDRIEQISTKQQAIDAIYQLRNDPSKMEEVWKDNFHRFQTDQEECVHSILDAKSYRQTGNTLGEQALVYYKYQIQDNSETEIYFIDQPEDNISNSRISSDLIKFLNQIRNSKQVIFITHNPLLVVNLDVDNVVFLDKKNDLISAVSGCLESEDVNILGIVSKNMDGGLEEVRKRLRMYGQNNN